MIYFPWYFMLDHKLTQKCYKITMEYYKSSKMKEILITLKTWHLVKQVRYKKFLLQLPASVPRKSSGRWPRRLGPSPTWENQAKLCLLASAWLSPGHSSHLGSTPADGESTDNSCTLPPLLSSSLSFFPFLSSPLPSSILPLSFCHCKIAKLGFFFLKTNTVIPLL